MNRTLNCWLVFALALVIRPLGAEQLPAWDAPQFMTLIEQGRPQGAIILADQATATEEIAARKLAEWLGEQSGVEFPILRTREMDAHSTGNFVLLGTPQNQPLLAELMIEGSGGAADLPFLDDEGFGVETFSRDGRNYLLVGGRTPAGVFHGAIYARDFLFDILHPVDQIVVRDVELVRNPALLERGPYLLPQYGVVPEYTLEHWKHIIDRMAEGGLNRIYWWVAGMYPSPRFPETFTITNSKMGVEDINTLIDYAHERGMKFLVGGGAFFWHGVDGYLEDHPELAATSSAGMCPSNPEARRFMQAYSLEWLETFPKADGLWLEPRDEAGACFCEDCQVRLDAFNSRAYGQNEISFLKDLMKQVWDRNPAHTLVWLIEFLEHKDFFPHLDDPLYFERIREIQDSRVKWMVVWEAFNLPGPGNDRRPVPFFTRNGLHWDKPYWPNLQNVFDHARICAEQGYLGYSNAWEIGFASNDWYIHDVPYPVDIIPEVVTRLAFREACWAPEQSWDAFTERVHRYFFSREAPRQLAEDILWLRQYITAANHEFRSPMEFDTETALADEVRRVDQLEDRTEKASALERLSALVDILEETRAEALPRMIEIEARLAEIEPQASRKTLQTLAIMRRAIDDSRAVYATAVPDDATLDAALAAVARMKEGAREEDARRDAATDVYLTEHGRAVAHVYAPFDNEWAGRRLAGRLKQWTGSDLTLQCAGAKPEGSGDLIAIGTVESNPVVREVLGENPRLEGLGEEGYILQTIRWKDRPTVVAAGRTTAGVNNAVSELITWRLELNGETATVPLGLDLAEKPALPYRILWSWDGEQNWPDTLAELDVREGPSPATDRDAFLTHFQRAIDYASDHKLNGIIIWGFIRDERGGIETCRELIRYANRNNVRLLPGICTQSAYGGFTYSKDSPFNLENWTTKHPELRFVHPRTGKPDIGICPSQPENIEWLREATRWFLETFPDIGGVNLENGDWMYCICDSCKLARSKPGNDPNFFWDQMASYQPVMEEIQRLRPDIWLTFATYVGYTEAELSGTIAQAKKTGFGEGGEVPPKMVFQLPAGGIYQWTFTNMAGAGGWPDGARPPAYDRGDHIGLLHQGSIWGSPVDPARWWATPNANTKYDDISELLKAVCAKIQGAGLHGLVIKGQSGIVSPANELAYTAMEYFTWHPERSYEQFMEDRLSLLYGGDERAELFLELLRETDRDANVLKLHQERAAELAQSEEFESRQQVRWRNLADEIARRQRMLATAAESEAKGPANEEESFVAPPPPPLP